MNPFLSRTSPVHRTLVIARKLMGASVQVQPDALRVQSAQNLLQDQLMMRDADRVTYEGLAAPARRMQLLCLACMASLLQGANGGYMNVCKAAQLNAANK